MSDKNKLIMFDGNAILHRAYHAFPKNLRTKKGELTNAIYGFSSTLLNVFTSLKPSHVVVAFDEKGPTFRHKKYKGYKASRPKMDDELVCQIERTREVVSKLNIPIYIKKGFEADDILGTISNKVKDLGFNEVIIITGDKDLLQLLKEGIKIFFPARGRNNEKIYDEERFFKEYGFSPIKMIDYKALAGDSSDEIPGVKGIGPKTATKLLKKYISLEGIYKNIEKIEERIKKKLLKDRKKAYLSYDLAKIKTDLDIKFEKKKSRLKNFDKNKIISLFEELEFFSLIKRLPKDNWEEMAEKTFIQNNEIKKEKQMSLF